MIFEEYVKREALDPDLLDYKKVVRLSGPFPKRGSLAQGPATNCCGSYSSSECACTSRHAFDGSSSSALDATG